MKRRGIYKFLRGDRPGEIQVGPLRQTEAQNPERRRTDLPFRVWVAQRGRYRWGFLFHLSGTSRLPGQDRALAGRSG